MATPPSREAKEGNTTQKIGEEKAGKPTREREKTGSTKKKRGWREQHHPEGGREGNTTHEGKTTPPCIWTFGGVCGACLGLRIISSLCLNASSVLTNVSVCVLLIMKTIS